MTFTTVFKDELLRLLEERIENDCRPEEIEYSRGQYKIKFDGFVKTEDCIFIIEIELRRTDPITNLVKVLHWICNSLESKKVKMIHLFDKNYYLKPENRYKKEFTLFLAKRCNQLHKNLKNFSYHLLEIEINERSYRKNDLKEAKKSAQRVCDQLIKFF